MIKMACKSLKWVVFLGIVSLLMSCNSRESTLKTFEPIAVNERFSSENINAEVLLSANFEKEKINESDLKNRILSTFKTNAGGETVFLGSSYDNNQGWVYFEVTNSGKSAQDVVVETNHIRCDGIEGFVIDGNKVTRFGKLQREIPLTNRPFPFYDFALPFNVQPNDTLGILLLSERFAGLNELNLTLYNKPKFVEDMIFTNYARILQISFPFVTMIYMLILGAIFKQRILLYYGIYLFSVTLLLGQVNYYYDTLSFPVYTALRAYNIGSFLGFFSNALYHPFGYQFLKRIPIHHKRYLFWVKIYVTANVLMMLGLLFTEKINYIIPSALTILTVLNFIWILYHSWLAYIRANVVKLLILFSLAFLPTLVKTTLNFFQMGTYFFSLSLNYFNLVLVVVLIAYLAIDQFRVELISKRNYEKNINELQGTMEEIRKSEIENIGRDLHDQVGNTLASALGYLNLKSIKIEIVKSLILDSINEIRFLSHNLVKDEDKPLTEKIDSLINRFNEFSTIYFHYNDFTNGAINQFEKLRLQNIYMIIQEILTNIIRHSKANEAYIQLFENDNSIQINIEDDGIGINNYKASTGIGLKNIHKRAELANLKLTIDSTTQGTTIIIEMKHENKSYNHR